MKLDPNRPMIPPAPHYPYFRYLCPACEKWWEREITAEDFVLICPPCREEEITKKRDFDFWVEEIGKFGSHASDIER